MTAPARFTDDAIPDEVARSVVSHMNDGHAADTLTLCRAFGAPAATSASLVALDRHGMDAIAVTDDGEQPVRLTFPTPPHDRAALKAQIVELTLEARSQLGISD